MSDQLPTVETVADYMYTYIYFRRCQAFIAYESVKA